MVNGLGGEYGWLRSNALPCHVTNFPLKADLLVGEENGVQTAARGLLELVIATIELLVDVCFAGVQSIFETAD